MKKIQTFIYVLLMGFAFAACQDDSLGGTEQGGIRIALTDGTAGVDVTTRSTPSELFDGFKQKFKFQIKGGDNYDQTHDWTDEVIPLAAGVYDITATCGTEQADGVVKFDAPCYTGTKEGLKVNAGETATTAEISCKVTNALVSIQFDDEYKEYITDATYAMIAVESGTETNWADLSTSAYFKAGSSLSKLTIFKDGSDSKGADILTDAQKDANFPKTFAAGDHLILTLSIAKANGNAVIKVSKVEIQKVTISETIPLEWLPKPKVGATGFDDNNTLTFAETETKEAKLNLDLASALQDIKFKFDFEDEQFSHWNRDTGYLYSNAEDKAVIETTLGISVSDDNINLNNLLAQIQTNAGEATTNTIEVDVKANNRWSSEDEAANRTYTITCNKPVFKVDAYPGNIWTKEFTMNALREEQVESGDFSKISQNIKYQYSTDGESNWTNLGDDLRQANLTPGTTYYIRGLYRDAVPSEVVEVNTYPETPLTNGGLEGATITRGDDTPGLFGTTYGALYTWNGWATLNAVSACYCAVNTAYSFNSRSGCRPTSDAISGSAIRVITLGYKGGGWAVPTAAMHSELYLGTSADDNGNKTYGIAYDSRPTGLSFYYKCIENVPENDVALIQIQVFSDDTLLGSAEMTTGTKESYALETLNINYDNDETKMKLHPNKLVVLFKSGTKENLSWETDLKNFNTGGTTDKTEDATFRGNELFIDEVSLVYDK